MSSSENAPVTLTDEMILGEDYRDRPMNKTGLNVTSRDFDELQERLDKITDMQQAAERNPRFTAPTLGSATMARTIEITAEGDNNE